MKRKLAGPGYRWARKAVMHSTSQGCGVGTTQCSSGGQRNNQHKSFLSHFLSPTMSVLKIKLSYQM